MPNKKKKNLRKRGGRSNRGTTELTRVHGVITSTAVAGVFPVISLIPDTFNRSLTISDTFDEYCVKKCRFRLINNTTGGVSHPIGWAFFPGITTTPPAVGTTVWDNNTVLTMQLDQTVPTPWKAIPRALLAGLQPWYKCKGAVTTPDQIPGQFYGACSGGTDSILVEFDVTFLFRGSADTGNTPEEVDLRARLRAIERARVMADEADRIRMILSYGLPPEPDPVHPSVRKFYAPPIGLQTGTSFPVPQ